MHQPLGLAVAESFWQVKMESQAFDQKSKSMVQETMLDCKRCSRPSGSKMAWPLQKVLNKT